jgi:hypothetical protein
MSADPLPDERDPRAQLSLSRDLARRVRREQRATWFPLLVFAAITFLAVLVNRVGHPAGLVCRSAQGPPLGARVCLAHNSATYIYWPVALVLAYAIIAAFDIHRSRTRGIGSRVRPYVVIGIAIAVVVTAASIWAQHSPLVGYYDILGWHLQGPDIYRLVAPAFAIGLGLLVLAAVERSIALLAVTLGYLIIVIGGFTFGWAVESPSRWRFAPHLIIAGSVLLLASIGFAIAQGRVRRRKP